MATEVLSIEATATRNAYQVEARVSGEEHTFVVTVNDSGAPLLGVSGDDAFYALFGDDIGIYRPILRMVAAVHAGEAVALPRLVERVLPAPRVRATPQAHS